MNRLRQVPAQDEAEGLELSKLLVRVQLARQIHDHVILGVDRLTLWCVAPHDAPQVRAAIKPGLDPIFGEISQVLCEERLLRHLQGERVWGAVALLEMLPDHSRVEQVAFEALDFARMLLTEAAEHGQGKAGVEPGRLSVLSIVLCVGQVVALEMVSGSIL